LIRAIEKIAVLMRINANSSSEMFDRYNSIDSKDLRQAVAPMGAFLANAD
jgi:hypothetical protein